MRRPDSSRLLGLSLALLLAAPLVGCDLQPPKHDAPVTAAPPGPPPGAAITADAATVVPPPPPAPDGPVIGDTGSNEGSAKPVMPVTQVCTDASVHIADIVIASITDPAQKAALEQDRAKLVRRAAETCTRDKWSDKAIKCFTAATTAPALEQCGKDLAPP